MKRLLLLTFLCVVPSAHAVDYVKCEAMQKAQSRIQTSIRQNKSEREDALDYAAELAHMKCGSHVDQEMTSHLLNGKPAFYKF